MGKNKKSPFFKLTLSGKPELFGGLFKSGKNEPEKPNIYFTCHDTNDAYGGIRKIYTHVDILNKNGFSAYVLHRRRGFRCRWFKNNTSVTSLPQVKLKPSDYIVLSENIGPDLAEIGRGVKKVIFNQGCYNTFQNYSYDKDALANPYMDDEVEAVIVVSEDSREYINHVFPDKLVFRVHNGIDPSLYSHRSEKKMQIAFIKGKSREDALQVINILKFRGVLDSLELVPIENRSVEETAEIMKESLIFLSFGYLEGFSLPPAEAMACGCVVIGYHGNGGREFFKPDFGYPIEQGNIIGFAKTVEEVIGIQKSRPEILRDKAKKASDFIRNNYSPEKEEKDIVEFWESIFKK